METTKKSKQLIDKGVDVKHPEKDLYIHIPEGVEMPKIPEGVKVYRRTSTQDYLIDAEIDCSGVGAKDLLKTAIQHQSISLSTRCKNKGALLEELVPNHKFKGSYAKFTTMRPLSQEEKERQERAEKAVANRLLRLIEAGYEPDKIKKMTSEEITKALEDLDKDQSDKENKEPENKE